MEAPAEVSDTDRSVTSAVRHVVAAVLGIGFAASVEGLTILERELRALSLRDATAWPLWVLAGLFVVFGAVIVGIVLWSRRVPWLPTAAALVLVYGVFASHPNGTTSALPFLGRWVPSVNWGASTVLLVTGAMTATAVRSWWLHRREAR